jgi:hypothetical protein
MPPSPDGDNRDGRAMFGAMDFVAFVSSFELVAGIDDLRVPASG